jgi:hypothetical protein
MSLPDTIGDAPAPPVEVQVTLSWPEAQRLHVVLPWLLQALADRPDAAPRQRERRRKTRAALETLSSALSTQLQQTEPTG